ncbi:protein HEATR9-like [Stegostoma tigrinum]|uniref:protein HEATR9-like n=1 Tax=Stegostoma tigrinum TaxID=3053191 RepID=UPI00202B1A96|nr:protein HEATR9-like [Stegostoma tigrinum]XP_048411123.1 protein HEATR9-like [Stegostoma tigrinum]XP_048411124.1 protein HEATR9-like [Stegostoma tigrinum]
MSEDKESLPGSVATFEYQTISLTEKKTPYFKEVLPPQPARWSKTKPESIKQQPHIINQIAVTCQIKTTRKQKAEEQKKRRLKHERYMQLFHKTTYAILLSVSKPQDKPRTVHPEKEPLKWQRLMHLIKSLNSTVLLERKDAVETLQCLRCKNQEVVSALYTTLLTDENSTVRNEAAKALVILGYWKKEVVQKLIQLIKESTGEPLQGILINLRNSLWDWATQPINQRPKIEAKDKLASVLRSFISNLRSKDMVPVNATTCLCYLNSNDEEAIDYIMSFLYDGTTYQKEQALEVVVRFLKIHKQCQIQGLVEQLQTSPVYKHRLKALDLLAFIGSLQVTQAGLHQTVLEALKRKLWDDPVLVVRRRAALVVNMLGMKLTVWKDMEQQLKDDDAEVRGSAVISLSVLGLPNTRVLQLLLEMVEVDLSQYVRFQIIRTFAQLRLNDPQVKRSLLNRQLGDGPLAREAQKAIRSLENTQYRKANLPFPDAK